MNDKKQSGFQPVDALAIFTFMREMNDGMMSQLRATNNNIASILRVNLDLQTTITEFIKSVADTRDKRYQEEIDALEDQMKVLEKLLDEKKNAKEDNRSTNEKIQDALTKQAEKEKELLEQERRRRSVDWIDVRNTALKTLAGSVAIAVVWYLTPIIARALQEIFAR